MEYDEFVDALADEGALPRGEAEKLTRSTLRVLAALRSAVTPEQFDDMMSRLDEDVDVVDMLG